MGCSASRSDGLEHEEALQHVIQMMRELKVKQIANIAARREGRRSREKYYGWAGVQGARAIAGGDAVLRKASISHANWRRGGPIDVVAPPGTLLDLPSDVTDTIRRRGHHYCSTSAREAWPTASILSRPMAGPASGYWSTSSPSGERARGPRPCGACCRCRSRRPVASSTRSSSGRGTVSGTQW